MAVDPRWKWMLVFKEGGPHDLPEPIFGWYFRYGRELYLSYIETAHSGLEGKGYVGRLLAAAQAQVDVVKVPAVISMRLRAMLERRGYTVEYEDSEMFGAVELMVWRRDA